jgi:hypothetical protein
MGARLPVCVLLALALVLAACAVGAGTASTTTTLPGPVGEVAGRVLAGPVCPVETDPSDPACADRPMRGAVIVVTLLDGSPVASVTSDAAGHFSLSLPPATYRFTPQPVEGLLGTAAPVDVVIGVGATTDLVVMYDTGIRGPEGA